MIFDKGKIKAECAKDDEADIHKGSDIAYSGKGMYKQKKPRKNADKAGGKQNVQNRYLNLSHVLPLCNIDTTSSVLI